jgi:hypothetical protein
VCLEQHARRAGRDRHSEERLRDRVMEFLGEIRSLTAGRELGGLVLELSFEPR